MRTAPVALSCFGDDAVLAATATESPVLSRADPPTGEACTATNRAFGAALGELWPGQ